MDSDSLVAAGKMLGVMCLIGGLVIGGFFYFVGFDTYDQTTTTKSCNKLVYSDTPSAASSQVTPLAATLGSTPDATLPYGVHVAQSSPNRTTLGPNRTLVPGSGNPIIAPSQSWEGNNTKHPGLFYDDGTYYLFYHSGKGTEQGRQIGVATSDDRNFSTWEKSDQNPVLENSEADWDADFVGHPEVIEVPNAASGYRYHMFYWGKNETWQLGHAMSNDLTNWVKDPANPIVTNGNSWDSCRLESPSVVRTRDGGFALLYHGAANTTFNIGLARSSNANLSTWTKSPANPVLVPQHIYEGVEIHTTAFQKDLHANDSYTNAIPDTDDGRYVIQYAANQRETINTAYSRNLRDWTRYQGNPIFDTDRSDRYQRLSDPDVYNVSGELHVFYRADVGDDWRIHHATIETGPESQNQTTETATATTNGTASPTATP